MSFFGVKLSSQKQEIHIPPGNTLVLLQACIDLQSKGAKGPCSVHMDVVDDPQTEAMIIANLDDKYNPNCALLHELTAMDTHVHFWTSGPEVHITGRWGIDEEGDMGDSDDDDEEEEEESSSEFSVDADTRIEEELQEFQEIIQEEIKRNKKRDRKAVTEEEESVEQTSSSKKESKKEKNSKDAKEDRKKKRKAQEQAEQEELDALAANAKPSPGSHKLAAETAKLRKKWKVKPENDEGVLVTEPRQFTKESGILVTDYVIGRGKEPKLGSKVKITYEGMYPDGTVFDKNLKRLKPLVFRKGAGNVVRGLDLGLDGLRIGGSREVVIPPELGYV